MGKQEDRFQSSSCGTSGGQNNTGRGLPSRTSKFCYEFHSTSAPYSYLNHHPSCYI